MKNIFSFILTSFFVLLCPSGTRAQVITTIAGGGHVGLGDGGLATACELENPVDVAIDKSGNLYIADAQINLIRKINTAGIISIFAGTGMPAFSGDGGQATAADIHTPLGMAIDVAGDLYFADNYNHRVRKISVSGIITTVAGNGSPGHAGDNGLATAAELNLPHYVAFDSSGNLYITDWGNNCIRKVNTSGVISTIAGIGIPGYSGDNGQATAAELSQPYGLAIDTMENIYFSEYGSSHIRKINQFGIITTVAGTDTFGYNGDNIAATIAQLYQPCGIALDSVGNLYVADGSNERIRKINNSGTISTIAGTGVLGFSGDGGSPELAELDPIGVTIDKLGNLYIADWSNNRIRYINNALSPDTINAVINTQKIDAGISVYPNPNQGAFIINISSNIDEQVEFIVTNSMGEKVEEVTLLTNKIINVSLDVPTGVYFFTAITGQRKWIGAITVLR